MTLSDDGSQYVQQPVVPPVGLTGTEYAWKWFELHAAQRMQLVNFWLVSTAFIVGAFVNAAVRDRFLAAAGVGCVGSAVAVGFLLLDRRTRQLIKVAEEALKVYEDRMAKAEQIREVRLVQISASDRGGLLSSYRSVIWGLQVTTAVAFVIAAVAALLRGV